MQSVPTTLRGEKIILPSSALDEPDLETVQAYFESQPSGDGSATLGDVMSPEMLGAGTPKEDAQSTPDDTAAETTEDKDENETKDDAAPDGDAPKES